MSGKAAIHFAKNEIKKNEIITVDSITGSTMSVEVVSELQYHGISAIRPRVYGEAYYTGTNEFWLNDKDPLGGGFLLN